MAADPPRSLQLEDFRLTSRSEIVGLLKRLVDERCLVTLSGPQGGSFMTLLQDVDVTHQRLQFSSDDGHDQLDALLEQGEVAAVAYLDRVKIQFDLDGVHEVRSAAGKHLRAAWPDVLYRFQRRDAFRVQPLGQKVPMLHCRHPATAGLELHLRVLDLSLGGMGLFLPEGVPPLPTGVQIGPCRLDLDDQTSLVIEMVVQHVTAIHPQTRGVRLGCALLNVDRIDRSLGDYINQTQKRRAALSMDRR